MKILLCAPAVLASMLCAMPSHGQTPDAPAAYVLILDATRGMANRITGGRKLAAAKDAAAKALEALPSDASAALIAYGETPKKRCEDVSDITPPAAIGQGLAAIKNALDKLQPKAGRAVQIGALKRAAELLNGQNAAGRKAVILVSDGADECAEDACAAASAFHQDNPSIPVHVIGLNAARGEKPRLQCIAARTGGVFLEAVSAPAVAAAMVTALAAAPLPVAPEPAAAAPEKALPEARPAPERKPGPIAALPPGAPAIETPPLPQRNPGQPSELPSPPPVKAEANVKLRAVLAPGMPPLQQGVAWRVYPAKVATADEEGSYAGLQATWSGAGAEPEFKLAPGRYYIEAAYGFASAGKLLTITAGEPADETIFLNAGAIEVKAVLKPGGDALEQMFYTIYAKDESPGGEWREVGRSSRPQAIFHVAAGEYRITAQQGYAEAETTVSLSPGAAQAAEIVINAGLLKLEARSKLGGPLLHQVFYFVYGGDGQNREIARSAASEPQFRLAGGKYRVVAQYDLARVEREVTVTPGQEAREEIILEGGGLRLAAKLSGKEGALNRDVQFTIYSLTDGAAKDGQQVGRYAMLGKEFFLQSGRYRVESKYGYQNAVESSEVVIAPGATRDVTFEHKAGQIRLALVERPGGRPSARARWTVKDANGAVIANTSQPAPELLLKPGKYEAAAQQGEKEFKREFEVLETDIKTVEIEAK